MVDHLGLGLVHHLEELAQVRLGVLQHLLVGEHGPGCRLTAGVADLGGPVSDDQYHLVPKLLQLPQLSQANHVAQVDVGSTRVEAHLEAEFLAALKQTDELIPRDDLTDTTGDHGFQVLWADLSYSGHTY